MSTSTLPPDQAIAFGTVTPVLRVPEVGASIDYYVHVLGFKINFQLPGFASVSPGRCGPFLCEGDQGHFGSWVWIDGKDVEAVDEEYKASGAKIRNPPTNYLWALKMQVEDPDGNILRLGSDPKKEEPIRDWLDRKGVRWLALPDGGSKRVEGA
jgi:uncharacterized glyoxalase superfamily protein PhnB